MKGRTIVWIVSAAMTVVAAGSLGLGIAGAADSNTSGGGTTTRGTATVVPAFVMGAVVKSNGDLARATQPEITSNGLGGGAYEVFFPVDVRGCAYVATIGKTNSTGSARPGFITTVGRNGQPDGVFLTTHDRRGRDAQRPFHLEVACPD